MQQLTTKNNALDEDYKHSQLHDYKQLLLGFADEVGQLEELSDYITSLSKSNELPAIDFESLQFELNC